jgi:carbonic anhydrase
MSGMVASIEYAVEHLHTPVIVVMGHSSCGAVKATVAQAKPEAESLTPDLDALVAEIMPAVIEAEEDVKKHGGDLVAAAIEVNARLAARNLLARSKAIAHAVSIGELRVVVAEYDLATGAVEIVEKDVRPGKR